MPIVIWTKLPMVVYRLNFLYSGMNYATIVEHDDTNKSMECLEDAHGVEGILQDVDIGGDSGNSSVIYVVDPHRKHIIRGTTLFIITILLITLYFMLFA
jgi:hypothetical protein